MYPFSCYEESAAAIRAKIGDFQPQVLLILGSGLGFLGNEVEDAVAIDYEDIPHFKVSTAPDHEGRLVLGKLSGVDVAVMQGRMHYYEGYTPEEVAYPVRVAKLLGVHTMIVTNAAGGINRSFVPGDLMLLTDHINFLGTNPLIGPNDERFGPRFPDISEAYSNTLIAKAEAVAQKLEISYRKGVYLATTGPCYETAAEIRAFAAMGADAVGMSTVPEVIVANYLGLEVLGISCITNLATGIAATNHSHQEVVRIANESSEKLCQWVQQLLVHWDC